MGSATSNSKPTNRQQLKLFVERYPFMPALLIMLGLLAMTGVLSPGTVSYRGLTGLLSTYLALMMLSVAQTWVVFAADIDLSAGAIVSLVNVSVVMIMQAWGGEALPVLAALGVGLAIGALCGLINGLVVAVLRLQAIVATFATGIFFTGLALYILPVAGAPAPRAVWRTFGGKIFDIPFVFYAIVFIAWALYALSRTRLVLQLLAVGDDAQSAFQSGLAVTGIRIKAYMLCGVFSALAAFCIIGDTASGDPLVGGKMTLLSVAAVVLGGSALSGGVGTVAGSVIGALTIGLINAFVYFAGTPSEWQNFVQGLAILAALMLGVLVSKRRRT